MKDKEERKKNMEKRMEKRKNHVAVLSSLIQLIFNLILINLIYSFFDPEVHLARVHFLLGTQEEVYLLHPRKYNRYLYTSHYL